MLDRIMVFAVIVCYRPRVESLVALCNCLVIDGVRVILVDNTEDPYLSESKDLIQANLISLGENKGIAYAQNEGIRHASDADVVVFFDQDSKVYPGFIGKLLEPLNVNCAEIVSPLCVDESSQAELPALRVNRFGWPALAHCEASQKKCPVDIVISSGTAATSMVFKKAGLFDEKLFIDSVDTEWCLRCRSFGIPIWVIPSAVMQHRIGSATIALKHATIFVHSPLRCYYQLRNSIFLLSKAHVPKLFAIKEILSFVLNRGAMMLYVHNRGEYAKAILQGGIDGLKLLLDEKKKRKPLG